MTDLPDTLKMSKLANDPDIRARVCAYLVTRAWNIRLGNRLADSTPEYIAALTSGRVDDSQTYMWVVASDDEIRNAWSPTPGDPLVPDEDLKTVLETAWTLIAPPVPDAQG